MSNFGIHTTRNLGYVAALGAMISACSAAEGEYDAPFEEVGTVSEALFYTKAGACANYEAENIGRTGGVPGTGGWKLVNAGDNINKVRTFVPGEHTFTIIAWGTAGGGQKPKLQLKLNDFPIGDPITVTNTSRTSGWSEYAVTYNINTGSDKRIKVELANPGAGRAVLIDGISVYCPKDGVVCGDEPDCEHCYTQGQDVQCYEEPPSATSGAKVIGCDQDTDCGSGELCVLRGTAFNGYAIGCEEPQPCDQQDANLGAACGEICKSPGFPETPCSDGRVCSPFESNTLFSLPGWKYCANL